MGVYSYLFPNSKLAKSRTLWRINLILETVYGGWTLIRDQVITKFQNSKDIQYGILVSLLENYTPLILTIYTITFKRNNFKEYFNTMIRIWVMLPSLLPWCGCLTLPTGKASAMRFLNYFQFGLHFFMNIHWKIPTVSYEPKHCRQTSAKSKEYLSIQNETDQLSI